MKRTAPSWCCKVRSIISGSYAVCRQLLWTVKTCLGAQYDHVHGQCAAGFATPCSIFATPCSRCATPCSSFATPRSGFAISTNTGSTMILCILTPSCAVDASPRLYCSLPIWCMAMQNAGCSTQHMSRLVRQAQNAECYIHSSPVTDLMDCFRAGRREAKCSRTFATGSLVRSRQASRK